MSEKIFSKRDQASLRTTGTGLRDIVNMIGTPHGSAIVERLVGVVMDQSDAGSAMSMAGSREERSAMLSVLRVSSPPSTDIVSAVLDNRVADLSAYDDTVLLGPLVIPRGFTPAAPIDRWVDDNLPKMLGKDLGVDTNKLKAALKKLHGTDAVAWSLLVAGRLKEALRLGRSFTGFTDEETRRIVRDAALLLQAAVTRMRGALIRQWMTRPLGDAVRYDGDWNYMGRTMRTSLVEPARQIAVMLRTLETNPTSALTNTWLAQSSVPELARRVEKMVLARAGRFSFKDAQDLLQHLRSKVMTLASITDDQIRSEGLGMRDFVTDRLGVSASYACVLLAASLFDAPRQIETCIDAVQQSGPVPIICIPRFDTKFGEHRHRKMVRILRWLRLTARTDRHAFSGGNGTVNDRSGSELLKDARKAFGVTPPTAAFDALCVDPRAWFS